jgi:hypothetical protein
MSAHEISQISLTMSMTSKYGGTKRFGSWAARIYKQHGVHCGCELIEIGAEERGTHQSENDAYQLENVRTGSGVLSHMYRVTTYTIQSTYTSNRLYEDFHYPNRNLLEYQHQWDKGKLTVELLRKIRSCPPVLSIIRQYVIDDFILNGYYYRWKKIEDRSKWKFISKIGFHLAAKDDNNSRFVIRSKVPTSVARLYDCFAQVSSNSINEFEFDYTSSKKFRFGYYFECDNTLLAGNRSTVSRLRGSYETWVCHNCIPLTNCRLVTIEDVDCNEVVHEDHHLWIYKIQKHWDRTWDLEKNKFGVSDFAKDLKTFCEAMFDIFELNLLIYGGGKDHDCYIHGASMELKTDDATGDFWFDSKFSFWHSRDE